jgi:hypothetical protein
MPHAYVQAPGDGELHMHAAYDPAGGLARATSITAITILTPLPRLAGTQRPQASLDPTPAPPSLAPVTSFCSVMLMEFSKRQRYRINGVLDWGSQVLTVKEAFGNCPKYIQARDRAPEEEGEGGAESSDDPRRPPDAPATAPAAAAATATAARPSPLQVRHRLSPGDVARVVRADTAFLGTVHPARGSDISHRCALG